MRAEWRKNLSIPPVRIFSSPKADEVTNFVPGPDIERNTVPPILEFVRVGVPVDTNFIVSVVKFDDFTLTNHDVVLFVQRESYAYQDNASDENRRRDIQREYVHGR
jgi:hypothetical protein